MDKIKDKDYEIIIKRGENGRVKVQLINSILKSNLLEPLLVEFGCMVPYKFVC